ncbi:MAG: hypothetical protein ABR501_00745 [Pyrinomonadaceae bacterium]
MPLYDNQRRSFTRPDFDLVRKDLTERFGGVTAFLRSPGEGLWKEGEDNVSRDDVVMFEVMAEELAESWWAEYRESLQERFRQETLLIRALQVIKL